ncbi:DUF3951 domain-containing protein [Paenibacillus aestuarii]|uniref:DUF3951 domain-containing protein n=1 Tax=Paenibacillus aestuarii TaxID=516965 RepID=A0ABW0K1U1_9BACL|nr:DUF3951 domain-containing protein [Paenibacillus aestuarii]
MDFSSLLLLSLIGPVFFLMIYIMAKTIVKKEIPDSRYNPFDYITGQAKIEFQEHKEEKNEDDSEGEPKKGSRT